MRRRIRGMFRLILMILVLVLNLLAKFSSKKLKRKF